MSQSHHTRPAHHFVPASAFTLEAFADLYTRSFAGYFYPMTQTVAGFSARVRTDHLNLHHSVLLLVNDVPAGEATLGLRGTQAWCGGFGIAPEFRGRGYGKALMIYVARLAKERDCGRFEWSVLDWNAPAIAFYKGLGADILAEWQIVRVTGEALTALAAKKAGYG